MGQMNSIIICLWYNHWMYINSWHADQLNHPDVGSWCEAIILRYNGCRLTVRWFLLIVATKSSLPLTTTQNANKTSPQLYTTNLGEERRIQGTYIVLNPYLLTDKVFLEQPEPRLKTGWCNIIKEYRWCIDPTIPDQCLECNIDPHNVNHLFNCPIWSQSI